MRSKKAMKNLITSFAYQIISIICGLITPRLILANFGSTYNGVINSATHFLSMISILTLGITGATRVALYKTLAENDTFGTSRIMKATKQYMHKVAIVLIIYVLILSLVYPYISNSELSHRESAVIIAIVGIGTFAQYFFGISNQTLLQADQASYVVYILDIAKVVSNTFLVAVLIQLGCSIYTVRLGSSIVFLITPAVMNYYVKRKYKLTSDCIPDKSGIEQRSAVAFLSIANLIHNNVDLVLLTVFTDAKIVSVYTVYYLVIGKIKQLMAIVTSGMEAAFGSMWAKGEINNLKNNFKGFEYLMFAFTTVVFSCVGLLILPFISRYTAGITDVEYTRLDLAVLITMAEAFHCIRQPYMTLVQATGHYKETKNGSAIEAIINLVVSIILIHFIGITGVIVGTLVANIFRTAQYAWFISKNVLHCRIIDVVKRLMWVMFNSALICVIVRIMIGCVVFDAGWIGWLLEALSVFAAALIITLITSTIFYRNDLKIVLRVGKRMIMR